VHEAIEQMQGSRERFRYAECERCGALSLLDPPPDLGPYYGDGYYSFDTPGRMMTAARAAWIRSVATGAGHRRRLVGRLADRPPWIEWFARAGVTRDARILDVGSGGGRRLDDLASAGFRDVTGIDPYLDRDRSIARGVRVLARSLGEVDGRFDLIMFNHSLEHVADQVGTLRSARFRLAEGGRVLVRIPVLGLAWDVYGVDWVQLDPPRHFVIHSEGSMRRAAQAAGLAVDSVSYDSTPFQFWGSELYESGVPFVEKPWSRGEVQLRIFRGRDAGRRRAATGLNRDGVGDQAQFLLSSCGPERTESTTKPDSRT
jgi:SAM-dependent methyltransferase